MNIKEIIKKAESMSRGLTREEISKNQCERFENNYNSSSGKLNLHDGVDCSKCKNRGYFVITKYSEENEIYVNEMQYCSCQDRRKIVNEVLKSGLGQYMQMKTKNYIANEEWQKNVKNKMVNFCKDHSEDNVWFAALGQSGCGKTMIASIISNHLLLDCNRNVLYLTWTDFIGRLKRDLMNKDIDSVNEYLDKLKNVDVLYIDELLKVYQESDLKYTIEIINYRYINDLKTIITSEKLIGELLKIDEATFSRVVEKSCGFIVNVSYDQKKNYRLKGLL